MKNYEHLAAAIRDVPDFPKKGILFKDITTLIGQPDLFAEVIDVFYDHYKHGRIDKVVGIEARGYRSPTSSNTALTVSRCIKTPLHRERESC